MKLKKLSSLILFSILGMQYANAGEIKPQAVIKSKLAGNEKIISADIFLPYFLNQHLGFIGLGYAKNNQKSDTASLGLGYRYALSPSSYIGANTYFDAIRSKQKDRYQQMSLGIEYGYDKFNISNNLYLPLGTNTKQKSQIHQSTIENNYLGLRTYTDYAALEKSADINLSYDFLHKDYHRLQASLGAYWQERKDKKDNQGIKLGLQWEGKGIIGIGDLEVGTYAQYDRENDWKGGLQFALHFGKSNSNKDYHEDFLSLPLRESIFTPSFYTVKGNFEPALEYGKVNIFNLKENPVSANELNVHLKDLGHNGLALMSGKINTDSAILIPDNIHIKGSGDTLKFTTASGKTAYYEHKGEAFHVHNSNQDSNIIEMGSNTYLSYAELSGGKNAITTSMPNTKNITIEHLHIHDTANHGIELNQVNGANLSEIKVENLPICENNANCEFSVYRNPNQVPNAALTALASNNINIDGFKVDNSTYGIFIASEYDDNTMEFTKISKNNHLRNIEINNVRREGLLFVGTDGMQVEHLKIDNSKKISENLNDMDLIVLQAAQNVNMKDVDLIGGINGLMIVNSPNLPIPEKNNIHIENLNIKNNSNSGVFINPANGISLQNVKIDNPVRSGFFLYGSPYDFMGGPVRNLNLNNVQINEAQTADLTIYGPVENINGEIITNHKPFTCSSNKWQKAILNQSGENIFSINGNKIENFDSCMN